MRAPERPEQPACYRDNWRAERVRDAARDSRRAAVSSDLQLGDVALAIRGECKARLDVGRLKLGEVLYDLLRCHAGSQVVEHVVERYPQPTDAGLAPRLPGSTVMRSR